ncbi:hypothetical protein BG000_001236 [Podila horticola]|nr:hypothetical protein BG000_001236 [Podila horticola]
MSKDITRLRAERNHAIDEAKKLKADRTDLQAKNLPAFRIRPSTPTLRPSSTTALKAFRVQLSASRQDQGRLYEQVDTVTREWDAAMQERNALSTKYQESEKRGQDLVQKLVQTRSDRDRLREQLEAASHGLDAMSARHKEAKAQADATGEELAWVKYVQEQLDNELKTAKQEQERLVGQVQECDRRTSVDAMVLTQIKAEMNNAGQQLERKDRAVIGLHQQLRSMGQILEEKGMQISELKEMLEKKGRGVVRLGKSLAKRARVGEVEESDQAKREDDDCQRLRQEIEEQQCQTGKQQQEIEWLNTMVAHHAKVAMAQKYEVSVGEEEIRKLKGELEEMAALHRKGGCVA